MILGKYNQAKTVTQKELKLILHYDKDTGVFTSIANRGSRCAKGDILGSAHSCGYVEIRINNKSYLAHRLAFLYVNGYFPLYVDHINRVKNDNRAVNLREVTNQENCRNMPISKHNTSGVVGVYWNKKSGKWNSKIKLNYKSKDLGFFGDKFDAICARKAAEHRYGFHINHGALKCQN